MSIDCVTLRRPRIAGTNSPTLIRNVRGVFADAFRVCFHASCRVRCAFPWRAPMSGPGLRLPVSTSATVWTASTALGFSSFRLALHYSFIVSCFAFLFIFLGPSSRHRFLVPRFLFFFFRKLWGPRKSPGSVPSPRPRPTAVRHDRSPHGETAQCRQLLESVLAS